MKYLITSSLLDSYDWLKTCPEKWKEKSIDDFISMIRREKRPTTKACQRGIDFERLICDNCNNKSDEEFEIFVSDFYKKKQLKDENLKNAINVTCEIAKLCKGGEQQVPLMKDIKIDGQDYHLFGYADIIHKAKTESDCDFIYDIKTCGKFKNEDYYLRRSQHYLYSFCTNIMNFEYLVADFGNSNFPKKNYFVNASSHLLNSETILKERIKEVINFIEISGLLSDYENIFTKEHKDKKGV